MPTRPPLPSTSPLTRLGPPASFLFVLALAVALPAPNKAPAPAQEPQEAWADVIQVPAGALEADAAKRVQKRPPCTPELEVEWEGLCWVPHATRPPKCAPGLVSGGGQCLMRVPVPTPPNTSVQP